DEGQRPVPAARDLTARTALRGPEEVLAEHIAVGAPRTDRFPLPLVTDRRVLHAIDRNLRGWTILSQAPAAEITGAEVKKGLISGRLQVHVRQGEGPSLRVN